LFIKCPVRVTAGFAFASLLSSLSIAQQSTTTTPSDPSTQTQGQTSAQPAAQDQPAPTTQAVPPAKPSDDGKGAQDKSGQGKVSGTSNSRLVFLPNFLSVTDEKLPPLTAGQKFKVVALGAFDPVQLPWWALLSGINQASNSEPAYGQGWAGYGKRYATTAADSTIENFMVGAIFPSILRQDPRFYVSTKGGFARRAGYAVSRIVITKGDSGHSQFNFSEVVGSATSAAISTYSYHPRSTFVSTPTNPHMFVGSDRTLANTADVWGSQLAYDTITIFIKEFWPDVARKMKKKKADAAGTPTR
jgi:hypothetical protein